MLAFGIYIHRSFRLVYAKKCFFISDGTGITAESFGQSLLSQFEGVNFKHTRYHM